MQFPRWARRSAERGAGRLGVGLLLLLAYVPALFSSPGRMPADTKLYLYLDPGGLIGRAASTFEPDQFAGWVPHQQITYLWPSGPWFWVMDTLGVSDWIAHRLWIATIMAAAGLGVRWMSRLLGLGTAGAVIAAMVYQLSPFLLPYISRTSLLLLPWAGLGWIVGIAVRATRVPRDATRLERWRDPALIALVVATVGSANATALALIVPAPAIWLLHAHTAERASARRLIGVAARTTASCAAVSAWWVAMLAVQSRFGAPVLAYSETLADVSRNATGSETLRGLGYWLFYVRDPVAPTTTASLDYLISTRVIVVSYAVILVSLAGLALVRWPHRRFAAVLVAVGMVLAVGVHPIGSPSPLMAVLSGDGTSGLALALRSSTRAMPVALIGLSLGAGSLVAALPRTSVRGREGPTVRALGAVMIGLLVVVNLPSLWTAALVDPAIDRDSDPPTAWTDAAATLDERADGFRTMQVPGAEFGAFRWGYTVDQPLVALTDRPVVTRDLLPLGSAAAMDLLYGFDDRWQDGTIEAASVAPVARLFGADTLWLTNDIAFERFRGPRPEVVDAFVDDMEPDDGIVLVQRFGEPAVNESDVPMVDPTSIASPLIGRPIQPVAIAEVVDPQPVIRAKTDVVVLSGSGDGVVDAAAAGLLRGDELIRYSASLDAAEMDGTAARVIVTDSNRDRAHHWRSSQDVVGHTEPGGPLSDVLVTTPADQRLALFERDDADVQTIAVQDGPVSARASAYGEPFAYRPEDRAVMAIDGDAATAWSVGDHGDPVGEFIEVTLRSTAAPVTSIALHQATPRAGGRTITRVSMAVDDGVRRDVVLDDRSLGASGQAVEVDPIGAGGVLNIRIEAVDPGDPSVAASRSGVGFSEIDLGTGATVEMIRPPIDALEQAPFDVVFTRLRVDAADPWRRDPEPALQRRLPIIESSEFTGEITLRLDRNAGEDALGVLLGGPRAEASARVRGSVGNRGAAAVDGDPTTSWITPFDGAIGASLTVFDATFDREVVLVQPTGSFSPITSLAVERNGTTIDVDVPEPDGAGRSVLDIPASFAVGQDDTTFTITAIDPATTVDRRYGDVITLPAAVATLGVSSPRTDPNDVVVECDPTFISVDGIGVPISFVATVDELTDGAAISATTCVPISLGAGSHDIVAARTDVPALNVDRVVLRATEPSVPLASEPPAVDVEIDRGRERRVQVSACVQGCWLVLGEGYNEAWSASTEAGDLGSPVLVDGGFNGWWIAPNDRPTTVTMRWTAQRPVAVALWWSIAAIALAVLVVLGALIGRRRRGGAAVRRVEAPHFAQLWGPKRPIALRPTIGVAIGLVLASTLLIGPIWAVVAGIAGLIAVLTAPWKVRVLEAVGLAGATAVALGVVWIERRDAPIPNAGWTVAFEHLNGLALFAVLALAAGTLLRSEP